MDSPANFSIGGVFGSGATQISLNIRWLYPSCICAVGHAYNVTECPLFESFSKLGYGYLFPRREPRGHIPLRITQKCNFHSRSKFGCIFTPQRYKAASSLKQCVV